MILLSEVIKVWDLLHTKDTGELGFCDLEGAVDTVIGIKNDIPPEDKINKPTIAELENILDQEEDVHIEILPNGELRTTEQAGSSEPGDVKPITMRESLGGEY